MSVLDAISKGASVSLCALKAHLPGVLTGIGIATYLSTIPTTVHCVRKYDALTEDIDFSELTKVDKFKLFAKAAWPVAAEFTIATVCVIQGQRVQIGRLEAVEAALLGMQKDKLLDAETARKFLGDKKAAQLTEEQKKARAEQIYYGDGEIIETGHGKTIFVDSFSGRKFRASLEWVQLAFNRFNAKLQQATTCSVNELYDELELPHCGAGDILNWDYGNDMQLVELVPTPHLDEYTGETYVEMSFSIEPGYMYPFNC